jgi:hypothetical protein
MALPLIGAAVSIGSSIFGAISAKKEERKAARQRRKEEAKMKEMEDIYKNLDTSNPYLNLENTMEDLTVNQQQAEFERQSFQQTQANILSDLAGAAGGSGIANLAQSLAQQGQIAAQKQAVSIGMQERQNEMARQQETGRIQMMERQGEIISRDLKRTQTSGLSGAASMIAGFGDSGTVTPGGIAGMTGAGTGGTPAPSMFSTTPITGGIGQYQNP